MDNEITTNQVIARMARDRSAMRARRLLTCLRRVGISGSERSRIRGQKAIDMQVEGSRNLSGVVNVSASYAQPLLSVPDKVKFRSLA
jgi:hypothetical protein